jgi:carbonic anhydrase/acetyltransferase-like protein (isoleucine patch superfamily)
MSAMVKSLQQFAAFRSALIRTRNAWLTLRSGVVMGQDTRLSLSARLRPGRRGSIRIGDCTLIAFKVLVYTRDPVTGEDRPVTIGRHCFIGGGSVILPGVSIGDESIVGANAVVFEDVPPRCAVGGNPARILRRDIRVGPWGRLEGADETTRQMWGQG